MVARFALALLSALVTLCATSAGALADNSTDVLVSATVYTSNGTTTDSVTLGALQADPTRCPIYGGPETMQELGRRGFVAVQLPPSGAQTGTWSLATLLGCMQTPVPLGAVKGITVLNADGSPQAAPGSALKPADLGSPSDFNDTAQAPVVESLGSLNQYDRPWRGGSDQDYLDEVQQSLNGQAQPIAIEVFEGALLTVTVHASRTALPVGGAVTFRAAVTGSDASGLSYAWSFGGGAPGSTSPVPQIRFTSAGQYEVTVQVTDPAGGGGVASIPITVGGKAPATSGTHKRRGAGTEPRSHSPTGPRKSAGHHPGGRRGNTNASGSKSSAPERSSGNTTSTSTATQTTPTSTASTQTAPTSAATAPHASPRTPRPHATAKPHPRPHATAKPHPASKAAPSPPPTGPVVAGRLISDVIALNPSASPLVHVVPATVASAPPARRAIRASLLPKVGAALAVVLLLGLGAARELGWRDRRRTLRPGN